LTRIQKIQAREILDSRGNPTVEVDCYLEGGVYARAAVPSGASTGSKEAIELRDGDSKRYGGKGVLKAVCNVNERIASKLVGFKARSQQELDGLLLEMDGDEFKKNLGANAILGVSLAHARAQAMARQVPFYQWLRSEYGVMGVGKPNEWILPVPLMNIINGGMHADNNLDIQEFMIVPLVGGSFHEALRAGVEVFHSLKKLLHERSLNTAVGDEGGFAPNLNSNREALSFIMSAIEKAGYRPGEDVALALDVAASEFKKGENYELSGEGQSFSSSEMVDYLEVLSREYPIVSIEDGLDEGDWSGWKELTNRLGNRLQLVGDDLFVTNPRIFQRGVDEEIANSILIKLNQIGTLTETLAAVQMAFQNHYGAIISHRSGETEDFLIADVAVGTGAGQIKTGSASRSDRLSKYNQLLRIEEFAGGRARFLGRGLYQK